VSKIEQIPPAARIIVPLGVPSPTRLAIHPSHVSPRDLPEFATMGRGGPEHTFEPAAVRYIKLGENGKWAANALEQGIIPFGYRPVDHPACLARDWDKVRRQLAGTSAR
jgi:hypothetical protein